MPLEHQIHCSSCVEEVGSANLKICSQCRIAHYCSEKCQRADWPTHKAHCVRVAAAAQTMDPESFAFAHAMSKWVACWRRTLVRACGPAMDLPHHPPDRLATHCVFIRLKRTANPRSWVRSFSMTEGAIMTRADFVRAILPGPHATREDIRAWEADNRGEHSLHICIECEQRVHFLWGHIPKSRMRVFRSAFPEESARQALVWDKELIAQIASGQPE